MSISLKKILFAGTALVALSYATQAHATSCDPQDAGTGTVNIGSSDCVEIDHDPSANPSINFLSGEGGGGGAYVDDEVDLTGNVTTESDGDGDLVFYGDSAVNGDVGAAGAALDEVWAGAEGSTVDFNGDVFAYDIYVSNGTANFNGDVNVASLATLNFVSGGEVNFAEGTTMDGNIDFDGYNGTVNFANSTTMNGDIYSGGEGWGYGTVNFAGSATVNGDIGYDGSEIEEVNINGADGTVVEVAGDIHTVDFTINVNDTGTLNIGGDSIEGALDFNDDGVVNWSPGGEGGGEWWGSIFSSGGFPGSGIGSFSVTGDEGADHNLYGGFGGGEGILKTFTIGGTDNALYVSGDFYAADVNNLNGNTVFLINDFDIYDGQRINTTVTGGEGGTLFGGHFEEIDSDYATMESGVDVAVSIGTGGAYSPQVGDQLTVIEGGGYGNIGYADVIDTVLLDWEQVGGGGDDDLIVEIVGRSNISDEADGRFRDIGDAIDEDCAEGCEGPLGDLMDQLLNAETEEELNEILEGAGPTPDGGSTEGALDLGGDFLELTDTWLMALRTGDTSGMAAGSSAEGYNMWLQGYGQSAEQDLRNGRAGYDSQTAGVAVGIDSSNLSEGNVLGFAFNFAQTDVDSDNANTTDTDIKHYGFTFYGSHDFGQQVFMNAQAGYAFNDIDSTRHDAGGPGLYANADYDSDQYMAKLLLGKDFAKGGGLVLTPSASASYTHLRNEGYTETGTGVLLSVDDQNFSSLKLGADINAEWTFKNADGSTAKPSVHAGYAYDAIGDNIEATASFVGGGSSFTTTGADPARSIGTVGAAITFATPANWDVMATYDYTFKSDYDSHAGLVRLTGHF